MDNVKMDTANILDFKRFKVLGMVLYGDDKKVSIHAKFDDCDGYYVPIQNDKYGSYILLKDYYFLDIHTQEDGVVYKHYLTWSLLQMYINFLEIIREGELSV